MQNIVLPSEQEAFINVLQSIGGGGMLSEAARKMQEAVKAAMLDGSSTSVTIKIEFKKQTEEALSIKGYSKVTLPIVKPAAMFFVTDTYLPSRERPNQKLMDFRN